MENPSRRDKNLEKNRELKKKDITVKTNIHILLNILKVYYANLQQGKIKPAQTDGIDRLHLTLDTRKDLDKHPTYEDQERDPPNRRPSPE